MPIEGKGAELLGCAGEVTNLVLWSGSLRGADLQEQFLLLFHGHTLQTVEQDPVEGLS